MKQLVVLSAKGGTGKTVVTAAFTHLATRGTDSMAAVAVDADVDASNLELLVGKRRLEEHEFVGGSVAAIRPEYCTGCGVCEDVCRFGAVGVGEDGWSYRVDPFACEGCATCFHQCPEEAIQLVPRLAGYWYRSESYGGSPLFHCPAPSGPGKLRATRDADQGAGPGDHHGGRLPSHDRGWAAGHRLPGHRSVHGCRPGPDRNRADGGRSP